MKRALIFLAVTALAVSLCFVRIFEISYEASTLSLPDSGAISVDYSTSCPTNAARCAIVIDADSRSVLYSENADERRGMASTTKIMTALVAIESCDLQKSFTVPKEACGIEGSSVYLKEGESLTVKELLYCLLLESGNDAATALAIAVGGSVDGFVEMMNERVLELSLENTHFANPHGLSDDNHYTTARELAIITAEAMQYDVFREIVATKTARVPYDGIPEGRHLVNHNKLLFSSSDVIGVKTGYTSRDGKCLVSAAEKNGLTLIAVTLQDAFPSSTHRTLLDCAFDNFTRVCIDKGGLSAEIAIADRDGFLTLKSVGNHYVCLPKGADYELELVTPEYLSPPIEKATPLCYAVCRSGGKDVYIIYLESTDEIYTERKSIIDLLFAN